jgi:NADPH:quinone reductase-like Zn-dependent oxidoreductase
VIVGGEGGGRWTGGFERALWALMLSPFVSQKLRGLVSTETAEDLVVLKELIEAGKVMPVIEKTYPLSDAAEAVRYLADGHARGKLVVTV